MKMDTLRLRVFNRLLSRSIRAVGHYCCWMINLRLLWGEAQSLIESQACRILTLFTPNLILIAGQDERGKKLLKKWRRKSFKVTADDANTKKKEHQQQQQVRRLLQRGRL